MKRISYMFRVMLWRMGLVMVSDLETIADMLSENPDCKCGQCERARELKSKYGVK